MDTIPVDNVRVQCERKYSPYFSLLRIARTARDAARRKEVGWLDQALVAMTFSALALEAVVNTFGSRLVPNWDRFERETPLCKLRVVTKTLGIDLRFDRKPWLGANWLVDFRKIVVHARPRTLNVDEVVSKTDADKNWMEYPKSALEMEINEANATKAVKVIDDVLELLASKTPRKELLGLLVDGFTGSTSVPHEP